MNAVCPYCGNNKNKIKDKKSGKQIVVCDIDDSNGCDTAFVVEIHWRATIDTYKIEDRK